MKKREIRVATTVRIKESIINVIKNNAKERNMSISSYIESIIIDNIINCNISESSKYIINKNNILKLELVKRTSNEEGIIEYEFKDINSIMKLEKDIIKVPCSNPTFLDNFNNIITYKNECYRLCYNTVMSLLYKDDERFFIDIQDVIMDYLKDNNLPVNYMNNSYDYIMSIATVINNTVRNKESVYYNYTNKEINNYYSHNREQYLSLIGMNIDWEYNAGKLKLINKYLTMEEEINPYDINSIIGFLRKFCNEWDSFIDGNFIWE